MSGCWCGSSGCTFHELDIDTEEEPEMHTQHKAPTCKKCGGPCRAGELTVQASPVEAAHAAGYEAGKAAGYAEAVANIQKLIRTNAYVGASKGAT